MLCFLGLGLATGAAKAQAASAQTSDALAAKPAEPDVARANRTLAPLAFDNRQDFDDAQRGFIATLPDPSGRDRYAFLKGDAPPEVNASLWRQAQLDAINGLFRVADGIYQVRGLSVAALTIVEGKTGVIVIDTLAAPGEAKAALDLYFAHFPRRPVVAVIYSHNHGDHYGGASALVSKADAASGKVKVIAPVGFMPALIQEASTAANLAGRRGQFQFGAGLPVGERGTLEYGEGLVVTRGAPGPGPIVPPNDLIRKPVETRVIDGVTFVFQLALDTEAPAEMHWYIPELRALTTAENCSHTMHNTYPIRGAQVRDPLAWSMYLNDTIDRWAEQSDVMYGMHHWPVWGGARVREMLEKARDAYRYIHDETLRLANHGLTPREIAEEVELPDSLAKHWHVRSYYGTISHNVKATYTRYLGWYDGNPANLEPMVPVESARRYVEFMGGAEGVIEKARESFEQGEYRWVSEVVGHVVFADPSNQEARELQADAFEQLGYQTESTTWRNAYLMGAQELRFGTPSYPIGSTASADAVKAMTLPMIFNFFAIKIHGVNAAGLELDLNLDITDTGEKAVLRLVNGTLSHSLTDRDEKAPVLAVTRDLLNRLVAGEIRLDEAIEAGELEDGAGLDVFRRIGEHLDEFDLWFPIIEP